MWDRSSHPVVGVPIGDGASQLGDASAESAGCRTSTQRPARNRMAAASPGQSSRSSYPAHPSGSGSVITSADWRTATPTASQDLRAGRAGRGPSPPSAARLARRRRWTRSSRRRGRSRPAARTVRRRCRATTRETRYVRISALARGDDVPDAGLQNEAERLEDPLDRGFLTAVLDDDARAVPDRVGQHAKERHRLARGEPLAGVEVEALDEPRRSRRSSVGSEASTFNWAAATTVQVRARRRGPASRRGTVPRPRRRSARSGASDSHRPDGPPWGPRSA